MMKYNKRTGEWRHSPTDPAAFMVLAILLFVGLFSGLVFWTVQKAEKRRVDCQTMCERDYPEEVLSCYMAYCKVDW